MDGFITCTLDSTLSAHLPALKDRVPLDAVHRALIIKLRHHGDVLLASPVLTALKAAAPHCEIDALVFADTAPMLEGHPALSKLFTLARKKQGVLANLRAEWQLFRALRLRRYDLVVHLTDHPRGAWLARALGAIWRVAPQRAKGKDWWSRAFTHVYRTVGGGRRHTVETHLDALRRIGVQPSGKDKRLTLVPDAAAETRIQALMGEHGLQARRFVHLHPASRWFFKTWPVSANAALVRSLKARGETVVITGAPDAREQAMVEAIVKAARSDVVNLAGQLSLKELAALTAQARVFVGVDSAPMHIAAAMQTPTVALFGPSGDKEWGPWQVAHRVLASDHSCRPCGLDGCGGGKVSECLTVITPDAVIAAIDAVVAEDARC